MRPVICCAPITLCLALMATFAHSHTGPSLPPVKQGDTSLGLLTLQTPGSDQILIRAGTFIMGSTVEEITEAIELCKLEPAGTDCQEIHAREFPNELSPHPVHLSDYWIDRTEVTVARYRQCVAAGICAEPPYASGGRRFDRPDFPVVLVSWQESQQFCKWAGGRLPTEAEWERAARGAAGRRYPWGQIYNPFYANHGKLAVDSFDASDGYVELAPVGSFPTGRTPDGIDDLAGNVEEWVADWYAPEYPAESAYNPQGPASGEERVVRGGSYLHARPWLRGATRRRDYPIMRRSFRGFRCVRNHE